LLGSNLRSGSTKGSRPFHLHHHISLPVKSEGDAPLMSQNRSLKTPILEGNNLTFKSKPLFYY